MTTLDTQIQDSLQPCVVTAGGEDTIESCKLRIAWLGEFIEQGRAGSGDSFNESDIAREIARLHVRMGDMYLARQEMDNAATCYETALEMNPRQLSVRLSLLKARKNKAGEMIKVLLKGLLVENPRNASLLNQLGRLHYNLHEYTPALDCFSKAVEVNPKDADSLYGIADIQQDMGDMKAAEQSYRRAMELMPLINVSANKAVPDFTALVIMAPLLGNTPTSYIMNGSPYERNICPLFLDTKYDVELMKRSGQVVFNTVSEADQSRSSLQQVAGFIDQLGMPVINHPAKIQRTTREGIAGLLQGLPQCRLGRVVRHVAGSPTTEDDLQASMPFSLPVLARPTGTHGGKNFEKIDSLSELKLFIQQNPETDHYLIEYVDYKSSDDYFRKYRFIFVNDQIMPYHLAIGDNWKVHHNTTDMDKHEWMQAEEKAFLEKPESVFSPQHYKTLRAIQKTIGLEYFGIDCGIDASGNLVVFEANASMMVHQHNEKFPYKMPFVENIKQAFGEMLKKCVEKHQREFARGHRSPAAQKDFLHGPLHKPVSASLPARDIPALLSKTSWKKDLAYRPALPKNFMITSR